MKNSEKIHNIIADIMDKNGLNIIEALIELCTENELEIDEIIKQCDEVLIERIKKCAIDEKMIQRKLYDKREKELPLDD